MDVTTGTPHDTFYDAREMATHHVARNPAPQTKCASSTSSHRRIISSHHHHTLCLFFREAILIDHTTTILFMFQRLPRGVQKVL
jgi:hypothetical protein